MMYCMAYLIITIVIPLVTWLFDPQPTYVHKGLRWNKTNAVTNALWILTCALGTLICDWILMSKVDHKYQRRSTRGQKKILTLKKEADNQGFVVNVLLLHYTYYCSNILPYLLLTFKIV